jgi:hypothetical protein
MVVTNTSCAWRLLAIPAVAFAEVRQIFADVFALAGIRNLIYEPVGTA